VFLKICSARPRRHPCLVALTRGQGRPCRPRPPRICVSRRVSSPSPTCIGQPRRAPPPLLHHLVFGRGCNFLIRLRLVQIRPRLNSSTIRVIRPVVIHLLTVREYQDQILCWSDKSIFFISFVYLSSLTAGARPSWARASRSRCNMFQTLTRNKICYMWFSIRKIQGT
jgi:hypothetical protein